MKAYRVSNNSTSPLVIAENEEEAINKFRRMRKLDEKEAVTIKLELEWFDFVII